MLETKRSFSSSPIPSRDSFIFFSFSFQRSFMRSSSSSSLFLTYSPVPASSLLIMLTMWCLLEVVLLGKQLLLLFMPMDLVSVVMLLLELKVRFSKSGFPFSVSAVSWLNFIPGLLDMLEVRKFMSLSRCGDRHASFVDLFSISSCCPCKGPRSPTRSGTSPESKFTLFLRPPMNSRPGDRGLKPSGRLGRSNLLTRSGRCFTSARRAQSYLSQSLRKLMMLRIMASSPSCVCGRQILTWFSSRSGLIHTKTSRSRLKKTMFSLMMKQPQQLASPQQAATMVRAYHSPRSPALNSLILATGSLRSSSIQMPCSLPSSLPSTSRGTPSMRRSSRRLNPSSSFSDLMLTLWHVFSLDRIINQLIKRHSAAPLARAVRPPHASHGTALIIILSGKMRGTVEGAGQTLQIDCSRVKIQKISSQNYETGKTGQEEEGIPTREKLGLFFVIINQLAVRQIMNYANLLNHSSVLGEGRLIPLSVDYKLPLLIIIKIYAGPSNKMSPRFPGLLSPCYLNLVGPSKSCLDFG